MNVAIIGCGLIGEKRLKALGRHKLIYAVDPNLGRAEHLVAINGNGKAVANWEDIIDDPSLDIVVIATTNNILSKITASALRNNKHVLVEKPAGRNPEDIQEAIDALKNSKAFAKVGFNHRFHPSLLKAKEILDTENTGDIMFIRGRYGHGGRVGYEKEWRFNKEISGGGELIDQGVHLIDLSRWFLGKDFEYINGYAGNFFWDTQLDDNGFLQLRTKENQMCWLHVSATEWKNMFSMEIYCKHAKLQIDGLGGSYGLEKLTYYKMLPEMGPPETTAWEYPFPDKSWELEMKYFLDCIERGENPHGNLYDAQNALSIIDRIYRGESKC